jgi:hypothetical protein
LEKSDFSNRVPKHAKKMKKKSAAQEIRFFGKFINRAQTCKKMKKKSAVQEIRFFGKIGFLNRAQGAQELFWKNRISQTVPKVPKKSDFLDLTRISFEIQWSFNFRFRALVSFSFFFSLQAYSFIPRLGSSVRNIS